MRKIIHFKAGVRFKRYTRELRIILAELELMHGFDWCPELIVTSVNDGKHVTNSKHYSDQALDVRSKNFPDLKTKRKFVVELRSNLGGDFTILFENQGTENEHFHIQLRKGLPPLD